MYLWMFFLTQLIRDIRSTYVCFLRDIFWIVMYKLYWNVPKKRFQIRERKNRCIDFKLYKHDNVLIHLLWILNSSLCDYVDMIKLHLYYQTIQIYL